LFNYPQALSFLISVDSKVSITAYRNTSLIDGIETALKKLNYDKNFKKILISERNITLYFSPRLLNLDVNEFVRKNEDNATRPMRDLVYW